MFTGRGLILAAGQWLEFLSQEFDCELRPTERRRVGACTDAESGRPPAAEGQPGALQHVQPHAEWL